MGNILLDLMKQVSIMMTILLIYFQKHPLK